MVLDEKGQPAIICVPGYYIPSSMQQLFSPQNYASFHGWANATTECYSGNDKFFWMQIVPENLPTNANKKKTT